MNTVTPEQAYETYKRTVRDDERHTWAGWVLAIHNSLAAGEWIGSSALPGYAHDVFNTVLAERKIAFSDSK